MAFHFTQSLPLRRTGLGNAVKAELGVPTPVAADFVEYAGEGCKVVDFDRHPYLAASGTGNLDEEVTSTQPVETCDGVLLRDVEGTTTTIWEKDYLTSPSFWDIEGEPSGFEFEVDYNSTAMVSYNLDRCSFAFVDVEDELGNVHRYKNVGCQPAAEWQASATYRMWGQTDSWGSEGEKILFIPWQDTRDW